MEYERFSGVLRETEKRIEEGRDDGLFVLKEVSLEDCIKLYSTG